MVKKVFFLCLVGLLCWPVRAEETELVKQGRKIFMQQCVRCHGVQGRGDGVDAKRLPVQPRDLVEGDFKFKSTEYGTPPSDDDLMWVLNHGMAGAGMPSYANLSVERKKQLIAYVKSISNAWGDYEPVPIEPPNVKLKGDLVKGKEMWETFKCFVCHGTDGRANGMSAAGLSVRPANLTEPWTYRAGSDPKQIYFRLMSGIAGSGMPSYKDAGFPKEDLWSLANYVASLQHHPQWKIGIEPRRVDETLPMNLDDAAWGSAPRTDVNMQSQYYEGGKRVFTTVNALAVQTLYNDEKWVMRLSWNDPTESTARTGEDALALAFKPAVLKEDVRDNLYTLYPYGSEALSFIKWKADNPDQTIVGSAPLREASRRTWRGSGTAPASARYDNGLWTIVITGPMNDRLKEAFQYKTRPAFVGFVAWDGGAGESWLKQSVSQWRALPMELGHN